MPSIGRRLPRFRLLLALFAFALLAALGGYVGWSRWQTSELLRRGEEALEARNDDVAREQFERYLAARPNDPRGRLLAARAARRLHLYAESWEHLRLGRANAIEMEPLDVEEALIDLQLGNEQSIEFLRQRTKTEDDTSRSILEVLIQHDLNTYQLWQALDDYTLYLKARPDDLLALLGRGFVWERFLYFSDALLDYRHAVASHPDSEQAHLKLANTLLIVGTPDEAEQHYRWLEGVRPNRLEVLLGLARCSRKLGRTAEAARRFDDILAKAPDQGEALWERGEVEMILGNAAAAEVLLKKAVGRLPFDRRVHYAMYRCLLQLDRPKEAESANARVAELDADLKRLNEIRQAVLKQPSDAALRCEGGLIFLRNGERAEGIHWLQYALRIDPGNEAARTALAKASEGHAKLPR